MTSPGGTAAAAFDAALAAYERGDMDSAERAAQETLRLDPQHTGALYMLGARHLDLGDAASALGWLEAAARNSPRHPGINRALGIVYQALERPQDAISSFEVALSGGAGDSILFNALGLAFYKTGDTERAISSYREALTLDPADPGIHNNIAVAFNRLHDFESAAQAYIKSLELDPRDTEVRTNLANLYEQMNRLEDARAEAEKGLTLDPKAPGLELVLARCERRDGAWEAAIERLLPLANEGVDSLIRRGVEFELGRDFDTLQDMDRAFSHFQEGNRISARLWPDMVEGAARYRDELDRMLECYSPAALSGLPSAPSDARAPVFLVSFPRSGTTLMDTILDAHPDVSVMEEEPALHYVVEELRRMPGGFPASVLTLTPEKIQELRVLYWREVEKILGGQGIRKLVIDKNPFYSTHAPLIRVLFPEARFIFALRHPCAVILSCFMQPFGRNPALANFLDLDTAAATYAKVMRLWLRYRSALPLDVHELRYESLVADKEKEVRALVDYLGLEWSEQLLDHASQAKKRGRIYTPSYHQVVRPIYTDSVERWRNYAGHFGVALDTLKPFIEAFGYAA